MEQQAVASDDVGCSDYRRMILDKLAESNRELEVPIQTERQIEREGRGEKQNDRQTDRAEKLEK